MEIVNKIKHYMECGYSNKEIIAMLERDKERHSAIYTLLRAIRRESK